MANKIQKSSDEGQFYEYREHESIIYGLSDEYTLSYQEYYVLFSFYVEHSMYKDQSTKKRSFTDYGWPNDKTTENGVKEELSKVLPLYNDCDDFIFTREDDLDSQFASTDLANGKITNRSKERGVFAIQGERKNESYFLLLFSRIRNCLAHGDFVLLLNGKEKMVVMQNHYNGSVTARFILKLETMMSLAMNTDKRDLLGIKSSTGSGKIADA